MNEAHPSLRRPQLLPLAAALALACALAPGVRAHEGDPPPGGGDDCGTAEYPSTFDAIQHIVFDASSVYTCANAACHGQLVQGDLDLTEGASYTDLLGADGLGAPSSGSTLKRVVPGEPLESLLYLKLLARVDPDQVTIDVGTPMPSGAAPALTAEHLEAVRLWIRGGAPESGIVEGTAELLGTCLPPPTPLKIPVPEPPPAGSGVQLQQTPWPLPPTTTSSQGEDEICMATFYDFTAPGVVPDWARVPCPPFFQPGSHCSNDGNRTCSIDADCGTGNVCLSRNVNNPGGECFRYHRQVLLQDPQSHHSIIHVYTGGADPGDPAWGDWTYKLEPTDAEYEAKDGEPCDPTAVDAAFGANRGCSGGVISSVACVGYGPGDASQFSNVAGGGGGNLPSFSGSQEPYYEQEFADGVFSTLPLRGVVVWNSHAFNLTETPSTMAQYLNIDFAQPEDQLHPVQGIFQSQFIFAQDVPAFGTQEICATYTAPRGSRLFQLSSHTHRHGVHWRTWAPPNTPCQPGCPEDRGCLFNIFCRCTEDPDLPKCGNLGYPRTDDPLYLSTDYSDPLQLDIEPPMVLDDPDAEDRTFLFCSLYDNGATPASPPVKRQSQSPNPPLVFGLPISVIGGPCPDAKVTCLNDGPAKGQLCAGDDAVCDSAPGAGDGVCDACPVYGGVTTEDEMFILLGSYYLVPEPGGAALGAAAALVLAAQARRARRRGAGR